MAPIRMSKCVALTIAMALALSSVPGVAWAGAAPPASEPETWASTPMLLDVPGESAGEAASAPSIATTPTTEPTATPLPRRYEDDHTAVRFGGLWAFRNASVSGRSYRLSRQARSAAAFTFVGTTVAWIGTEGPTRGQARVYVDGRYAATVDLYSPVQRSRQVLWVKEGLSRTKHTVTVVVAGTKNPASSNTLVDVDAFGTDGWAPRVSLPGVRVQNGDSRLYRKGTWGRWSRRSASGKSSAITRSRGAGQSIRFRGTAITWLGRKGPDSGKSEVWLDGKRLAVVDQYSTTPREFRVVYAVAGLKDGLHTLTIRALGSPAVQGGGTKTDLDAFQVVGKALVCPRPTPFKYPWKTYIVIDKSSYKLYWVKNGWLIKTYPIAHGKGGCTPERVWRIGAKYPHTGGVYGPRKMRLFKRVKTSRGYRYVHTAYAIHGTNQEWVIGTQASHGCIRMYNRDVKELYPQVPYGTMVVTRR